VQKKVRQRDAGGRLLPQSKLGVRDVPLPPKVWPNRVGITDRPNGARFVDSLGKNLKKRDTTVREDLRTVYFLTTFVNIKNALRNVLREPLMRP
jgi:hypothetical protein